MTFGALIYFLVLAFWSMAVSYFILFRAIPYVFRKRKDADVEAEYVPEATHHRPAAGSAHHMPAHVPEPPASKTRFSAHEGFKSLATGPDLTVEDIVKGLSRE